MKNLKWILLFCLPAFLFSCGYHFEGGGYLKDDVTRVAVKVLENKSSEPRAGSTFTNALIREILQKTDTRVVDESRATAVLEGSINAILFATVSRSSSESVIERRVSARVDLRLIDKDGSILWAVKNFTSDKEYTVSKDQITDESNKRAAVDKIAVRSAEQLVSKMLTNF